MAYSYNKLWKLMIDKKINKTRLRQEAGITSNAMTNMGKDMPVSVEVLAKICRVLDCTIDDIVEILPDDNESKNEDSIVIHSEKQRRVQHF